jgi:hypothetical protein
MKGTRQILRAIVLTAAACSVAGCVATSGGAGSSTTSIGDLFHVTVTDSSNDGPTLLQDTIGNIARSNGGSITAGEEALAQKVLTENADKMTMSWENAVMGEVRMQPYSTEVRQNGTVCRPYGVRYVEVGKIQGWVTSSGVACKDSSGTWRKT